MSYYSSIRHKVTFCKSQHKWLYTRCVSGQWTDSRLWSERNDMIYNRDQYSSLPQWAKSELTGYFGAKREAFYDEHIVFCHVIDGKPCSIPEYRELAENDPDMHRNVALAKDCGTFWKQTRKPFGYTGPEVEERKR